MSKLIYTERRLNKYKNRLTDHIREVYGLDCWLKRGYKVIDANNKTYIPLFIEDDKVCGLINIKKDESIIGIFLEDGSSDFNFKDDKIKFV